MTTDFSSPENANALIPADIGGTHTENALSVAKTVDYFPRIKLCQGQAKEVAHKHVASGGNFALIRGKDEIEDLGDSIDVLVCTGRPKAMRTGDQILTVFEEDSEEFKKIMAESKVRNSGCFYGVEYLVYIPAAETFATLFLNNPTMRRKAGEIHSRLRAAATISSQLIETSEYQWYGPKVSDCSSPLELPEVSVIRQTVEKYENEKSSQIETVEDSSERER